METIGLHFRHLLSVQPDGRQRVLAEARNIFTETDIDAVSVEAICRRASVSKRTFYRWFENRHVLFAETASLLSAAYVATLRERQSDDKSLRLSIVVDFYLDTFLSDPLLQRFRGSTRVREALGISTETLVLPAFLEIVTEAIDAERKDVSDDHLPWFVLLQLQAVVPHLQGLRDAGRHEEELHVREGLKRFLQHGVQG
ncbi:TetR family transcriptional regulator [bacterium]|nr:TetR family transcriptional regulator [bacterium]